MYIIEAYQELTSVLRQHDILGNKRDNKRRSSVSKKDIKFHSATCDGRDTRNCLYGTCRFGCLDFSNPDESLVATQIGITVFGGRIVFDTSTTSQKLVYGDRTTCARALIFTAIFLGGPKAAVVLEGMVHKALLKNGIVWSRDTKPCSVVLTVQGDKPKVPRAHIVVEGGQAWLAIHEETPDLPSGQRGKVRLFFVDLATLSEDPKSGKRRKRRARPA